MHYSQSFRPAPGPLAGNGPIPFRNRPFTTVGATARNDVRQHPFSLVHAAMLTSFNPLYLDLPLPNHMSPLALSPLAVRSEREKNSQMSSWYLDTQTCQTTYLATSHNLCPRDLEATLAIERGSHFSTAMLRNDAHPSSYVLYLYMLVLLSTFSTPHCC